MEKVYAFAYPIFMVIKKMGILYSRPIIKKGGVN